MHTLFTIGYSCHNQESLLRALKKFGVTALADVRSQPFSKYKPEFNRDILSVFLARYGLHYVFLGDECGARIQAQECYTQGKINYRLISKHPIFLSGLERIRKGIVKQTIALMCAEKDPLNCHRTILICRNLRNDNIDIEHILCDNTLSNHRQTEARLLQLFHLDTPDLFKSDEEKLNEAYDRQGDDIAYEEVNGEDPFYEGTHGHN